VKEHVSLFSPLVQTALYRININTKITAHVVLKIFLMYLAKLFALVVVMKVLSIVGGKYGQHS
jgi:hypothetical protein